MFAFSAMPIPVPVAGGSSVSSAPVPATKGINFRGSELGATDPAGYIYTPANEAYPTSRGGIVFGQTWSNSFCEDSSASGADERLKGYASFSSFNVRFRVDTGNGSFNIDIGAATKLTGGVGALIAFAVWDGSFSDEVTTPGSPITLGSGNVIDYPAAGSAVVADRYVVANGAVWRTAAGGTTGGVKPSGSGPVTDGTVTWIKIKTALLAFAGMQNGTQNVFDANGTAHAYLDWPANKTTKAVVVTKGYVTITRGETTGSLRSFAWTPSA